MGHCRINGNLRDAAPEAPSAAQGLGGAAKALSCMPSPIMAAETADMLKTLSLVRQAHECLMRLYGKSYEVSAEDDEAAERAVASYIDWMAERFVMRAIRGRLGESGWTEA